MRVRQVSRAQRLFLFPPPLAGEVPTPDWIGGQAEGGRTKIAIRS